MRKLSKNVHVLPYWCPKLEFNIQVMTQCLQFFNHVLIHKNNTFQIGCSGFHTTSLWYSINKNLDIKIPGCKLKGFSTQICIYKHTTHFCLVQKDWLSISNKVLLEKEWCSFPLLFPAKPFCPVAFQPKRNINISHKL